MNKTAREYKMRAECQPDADLIRACLAPWLERWQVFECHLEHKGKPLRIPDVDIEFTTAANGPCKGELKWMVSQLEDCHVAAESLDGVLEYTGKRYDLDDADCIVAAPTPEMVSQSLENLERYREYLEVQMKRLTDARSAFAATVAIARLSSCASTKRASRSRRGVADKR